MNLILLIWRAITPSQAILFNQNKVLPRKASEILLKTLDRFPADP